MPHIGHLLQRRDQRFSLFIEAWRAARGDSLVPWKSDFDPLLIPTLLRFVWIYRFEHAVGDFVCLLSGEEVNKAWRRSIKGETLEELVGPRDHKTVLDRWIKLVQTPAALLGSMDDRISEEDIWRAERMILPLRGPDGAVDHLIGLSLYHLAAPVIRPEPGISDTITLIPCSDI